MRIHNIQSYYFISRALATTHINAPGHHPRKNQDLIISEAGQFILLGNPLGSVDAINVASDPAPSG